MWYAHVTNHKFYKKKLLISKIVRIPYESLKLLTTNTKKVTPFISADNQTHAKEQVFCGFGC